MATSRPLDGPTNDNYSFSFYKGADGQMEAECRVGRPVHGIRTLTGTVRFRLDLSAQDLASSPTFVRYRRLTGALLREFLRLEDDARAKKI
jgi:hypothetical protein